MIRILLVGKRKQTITWASTYLRDKHKLSRLRLLDGVKRIVHLIYGTNRYYDYPWEKRFSVYNSLYRLDPEVWVKYLVERRLGKLSRNVVVDDPHYINEVNYLAQQGFIVVRINVDTDKKPRPGRALLDSEAGTVLLQEYFGTMPAYKIDYNISATNRYTLYRALDDLMLKLNTNLDYNTSVANADESQRTMANNTEALYEEKERPSDKSAD